MISIPSLAFVLAAVQVPLDPETGNRVVPLKDEVSLSVATDRSEYYRGERIRLTLSMTNTTDHEVEGLFRFDPSLGGVEVLYRPPGAVEFVRLQCFLRPRGEPSLLEQRLGVGQTLAGDVDLSLTSLEPSMARFLLDTLGTYEFRVRFVEVGDDPNAILESNTVAVEVVAAPTNEREAQAAYATDLAYLAQVRRGGRAFVPVEQLTAAMAFIGTYRGSRYVGPVREGLLKYLYARAGRASAEEKAALETLTQQDDTTPPRLWVGASPPSLWPPNNKLVQVLTTVSVSDAGDSNPTVKLESITCDDNCVPAEDIVGADRGTDDREFELRAKRTGSGTGRTYTTTYSATDASGNRALATATVVVPHDQGK